MGLHKANQTSFKKGQVAWNKGTKGIMKSWNKGKKCPLSELTKQKMKGKIPWNKGIMGYSTRKKGTKHSKPNNISDEMREKMRLKFTGKNNPKWKGGSSKGYKEGYWSKEYLKWRKAVFERDNYTCQVCRKVGVYLTAHHI